MGALKLDAKVGRQAGIAAAVVIAAYLLFAQILPHTLDAQRAVAGPWQAPAGIVLSGAITGAAYGLLGVGLVLIYRTNRIINFAHGDIGAFGAVIFALLVKDASVPYWIALIPALIAAGIIGAVAETAVIRRLRKAPLVMSVIATLGIGQFLGLMDVVVDPSGLSSNVFPLPPGLPTFQVGPYVASPADCAVLIFAPLVVIAIGAFLRFSRFGIALRCAADNPEAARMAGIFASRMSTLAWAIGGGVAALTAIFTLPGAGSSGAAGSSAFGPALLQVALAAAVIGRMENMPLTLAAGVGIGIIQKLLLWNFPKSGVYSVILFALILLALLLQKNRTGRAEAKGSWTAVASIPVIPAALKQQVWAVRNLGRGVFVVVVGLLCLLPLTIKASTAVQLISIFALIIVGLSAGVITGLAGQLSLGQFGIAGVGGLASYEIALRTNDFYLSFLYAGIAAAIISVAIGIPALRVKGLLLTVTTLSFALVVPQWLLPNNWAFANGVTPSVPVIFGQHLDLAKHYYFFALGLLILALWLARNVRSGGLGRLLVAVRDNEDAARAFTVSAIRTKVTGFAVAGFLAGLGGALYMHSLASVNGDSFDADDSIKVLVMAVIGGLGLLSGPILGSLIVFVLPTLVNLGNLALAGTSLGQLLIIMYLPGGLGQLVVPIRDRIVKFLGRRAGVDVEAAYLEASSSGAATRGSTARTIPAFVLPEHAPSRRHGPILQADHLVRSFGGVRAVRGVSMEVHRGEILGLIGPNGAGKTTTFELLAGFTRADEGRVLLHGEDVTALGPEARGHRGLIRSFQDAALFPTLTVFDCVKLSLERNDPNRLTSSLLGFTGQERNKEAQARELVDWMGLDRYKSAAIASLSTGTRRITEIACLVGMTPEVLLLDEPCAGVAQRETEALAQLLVNLKNELDLTLMIIEHDIPMIMGLSDRIVCMADGEIIAQGSPEIVRTDPRVVESYLGGSLTAIERSGTTAGSTPKPKNARPRKPALVRTAS